jgi:hypothetical protein
MVVPPFLSIHNRHGYFHAYSSDAKRHVLTEIRQNFFLGNFECKDTQHMLMKFVSDLADQSGIKLSSITLVDGRSYGLPDTYLLQMFKKNRLTTALIYQSELDDLEQGIQSDLLENRITSALASIYIKQ